MKRSIDQNLVIRVIFQCEPVFIEKPIIRKIPIADEQLLSYINRLNSFQHKRVFILILVFSSFLMYDTIRLKTMIYKIQQRTHNEFVLRRFNTQIIIICDYMPGIREKISSEVFFSCDIVADKSVCEVMIKALDFHTLEFIVLDEGWGDYIEPCFGWD